MEESDKDVKRVCGDKSRWRSPPAAPACSTRLLHPAAPPLAWTTRRIWCCCERDCAKNLPLCCACVRSKLRLHSVANCKDFTRRAFLKTALVSLVPLISCYTQKSLLVAPRVKWEKLKHMWDMCKHVLPNLEPWYCQTKISHMYCMVCCVYIYMYVYIYHHTDSLSVAYEKNKFYQWRAAEACVQCTNCKLSDVSVSSWSSV